MSKDVLIDESITSIKNIMQPRQVDEVGTSTVRYITPLPCIGLSESDSKLSIKFIFCEEKNLKHLKNNLIYKAKKFMLTIFFSRDAYIL